LSGKLGNVWEFNSCQGKILSRVANFAIGAMPVFRKLLQLVGLILPVLRILLLVKSSWTFL